VATGIPEYYSAAILLTGSGSSSALNFTSGSAQEMRNLSTSGTVSLSSPLKLNGTLTLTAGTLNTNGNALTFGDGSRVTGTGTINGNITMPLGAAGTTGTSISAGNAGVGTLNINGNLTSSADMVFEIGGASSFDQILVSGAVSLSGDSLRVLLVNAFDPPENSTFVILDGASLTGTFNTTDLPILTGGKTWSVLFDNVAGTVTLKVNGVIPVELSQFTAKRNQTTALLYWRTESERDNAVFHIEQSTNGTDFQTVGQVKGGGTRTVATAYSFDHKDPSVGVNYYRLKQVDANGTATFSAVRSILMGKTGLVVKTTLVSDILEIIVSDEKEGLLPIGSGQVRIFNISGQNILNVNAKGTQSINVSNLPAGLYIIRTATGEVGRFVKQ
jgi:hypothetical protein